MKPMPPELPGAIHQALRTWHTGQQPDLPWREMYVVAQRLAQQPVPDLTLAVRETLLEGLAALDTQRGSVGAQILQSRFLDGQTARATAQCLNLTEDVVYKRQRAALGELASLVWQAEANALLGRAASIEARLEIPDPPLLFGIERKLVALTDRLCASEPPWLMAVVGIGGIGKTSLADAAVRKLVPVASITDIAWVSARQDSFTLWGGLQKGPQEAPALAIESLVDALVEQFGFDELSPLPTGPKRSGLRSRLKAQPYLVVIDNLETASDYAALIPELQTLVNPTQFLLTSRHSLHDYPGVHNLTLDELSAIDSLTLLRYEAAERGVHDVAQADEALLLRVHDVAGGNPLALKLVVGQMHTLPLSHVVEDLRQARGRTIEDLYHHIYWRSWQLLDQDAKRLLVIMPQVAETGGRLDQLAAISGLGTTSLAEAVQQLLSLCLLIVRGTPEARRYSIHRLTESFLLEEVVRWQASD
jgi:hypothetical protein